MKNSDMLMHIKGKSVFIDDIRDIANIHHGVIFTSPVPKGIIKKLDVKKAEQADGVAAVFTYKDVPGENQIGHIIQDQPLLAEDSVNFVGDPIALVVAETRRQADNALKLIEIEIEELEPVSDPREAYGKGELLVPPRLMCFGETDEVWDKCETIVEGTAESGAQEHFYLETQGALSLPIEDGKVKVFASSQAPGGFQHTIAEVLGVPMHLVEIDIKRLGGAFGGKESCATWAALSAMAAKILDVPVKVVLNRKEDIQNSPKRHPYITDYKLGLDSEGKILAYEVMLYQNSGAYADISLPVLERSFLHAVSSYKIPNAKIRTAACRTNIVPNGAFRGFGVPQSVFAIESAIFKAAEVLGLHPSELQKKNLIHEADPFPYGMAAENCNAEKCWNSLDSKYNIENRIEYVKEYNEKNVLTKKGIAVQPVCFGVSFTQTALNQAGALVHIYTDGSLSVSTGAVEMGQGVNLKIAQIAAEELSVDLKRIKVETTNTTRVANASPTAASTGADLNGMAAKMACSELLKRLKKVAAEIFSVKREKIEIRDETVYAGGRETDITWEKLVNTAYWEKTDLSCHAFYATPLLKFDRDKEWGRPFAYHAYGTSLIEVTLDCIKGTYKIDSVDLVHDVGNSINEELDEGQIEGAVVQALGWSTIENMVFDEKGNMLTSTNSYKVPDIKFLPEKFNVHFLENAPNPYAVSNSKAVGEPPLIHGCGAYFAILNALTAVRKDKEMPSLPLTPEKAFMYIYEKE
ncbi:MAG: molybdopterin-dependent oxidoreductase [Victivallales bacterium]|nr:molybdopterin-dependent oxidoreductase [Victivallales bacterium]